MFLSPWVEFAKRVRRLNRRARGPKTGRTIRQMTFAGRRTRLLLSQLACALTMAVALAACQPVHRNHGFVPDDADLAQVVVGQTTQGEVEATLGRPSAQGLLAGSSWFYVKSRFRHYGAAAPEEIGREVVALTFDEAGTVANVERFGLERGRVVVLSRRVTDPGVSAASALRQILGNFGRFRADQIID